MLKPDPGIEGRAGDAADDWPDDRNPRVLPVGGTLAGNRQDGVRDARTKIASRIDRVAGRAAEREADAENEQAHEQWLQAPAEHEREVHVSGFRQRLGVRGDRQNAEQQDSGADRLTY